MKENIKIIANRKIHQNYFKIILKTCHISGLAKPGQFVEIKISDAYELLLRRPLSIHRVRGSNIEILYEVVGLGTKILSQKKPGEYLDVIGPLGNGFDLRGTRDEGRGTILVAGGVGVAPLFFLAEKIMEIKYQKPNIKNLVLIGAKTKTQILCEKEFRKLGFDVKIATDDGSRGLKGKVTDLLRNLLSTIDYRLSTIYACGPRPMLKEIARISQGYKIPAQVSLEEHMACGIGACLGCVVKTRDEGRGTRDDFQYQRVCKEGPVFEASQIIWKINTLPYRKASVPSAMEGV